MSRKKKVIIGIIVVVVLGAAAGANVYFRREQGPSVEAEAIRTRDLEAIVSASGRVQPKRQINISANQMGRVTRLAVEEGQRVKAGQFLLEIDPRQLEGQLQRGEASVAAAKSGLAQARVGVSAAETALHQARTTLELAQQNLKRQQELWKDGLTTREALERAQNEVTVREADVKRSQQEISARQQEIETREQQIKQEQAGLSQTRYNLTQIIIQSPMDGIVVRRNIEEGETAVVGTMNNAGSQLLTIADMSVLEAEVEVDETDIPLVAIGQEAKVTVDAVEDRTFRGHVTEIGNSPIQTNAQQGGQRQATTFRVVVTLDEEVPNVRPGFTCTVEITTSKKQNVTAVPIQALTVRELLFDPQGKIVREESTDRRRRRNADTNRADDEVPAGHKREETEGVFIVADNKAVFTPVKIGIAGEQYFEVLEGLKAGDRVITGPFANVRELADGQEIRLQEESRARSRSSTGNSERK
ncbi:MAG TPA: efflux RND transporter periplasmic adaptor subunit [Vicinamibacterales bacterium]|nr:efflux RND transporter periplasmic adaptor subunit [Vicinamibacterales bacterium]